MYCHKCGKELATEASFCSYCGTKIASENTNQDVAQDKGKTRDYSNIKADEGDTARQLLINQLSKILPYVKHVERELEEISELEKEVKDNIQHTKNANEGFDMIFLGSGIGLFIWIVLLILCAIVSIPLFMLFSGTMYEDLIILIVVAAATVLYIMLHKKAKQMSDSDCDSKNKANQYEIERHQKELKEYCKKSNASKMIEIVPKEYCCKDAIEYILSVLRNGRAKDMQ